MSIYFIHNFSWSIINSHRYFVPYTFSSIFMYGCHLANIILGLCGMTVCINIAIQEVESDQIEHRAVCFLWVITVCMRIISRHTLQVRIMCICDSFKLKSGPYEIVNTKLTNVTTFLLMTHIQLESVTFYYTLGFDDIWADTILGYVILMCYLC